MDCVVGYHLNPMRCGVAKFNARLANRLDVPVLGVFDDALLGYRQPLISLKIDELTPEDLASFPRRLDQFEQLKQALTFRLFLHNLTDTEIERRMIRAARAVYVGNAELRQRVGAIRSDVVELWAPGMIDGGRRFNGSDISVFSFGMAHKVRSEKYRRLKELLDRTGKTYGLYISTALHENSAFDDEFGTAFRELQAIFGDRAHFLGYLSDSAVYNYLLDTTFYAAFFDTGVRGNNTSVNAAIEIGCNVITNLDQYSPSFFLHGENVLDIEQIEVLPTDPQELATMRQRARALGQDRLSWEALATSIRAHENGASAGVAETWTIASSR
jgi:hypothetical protein